MAHQKVVTTSYGQRVGNSFKGILTGIVLFIGGTILLWWNEGNSVKTDKMLNRAEEMTVPMDNINKVDSDFEGKLAYAVGETVTQDSLLDEDFPVGSIAIKLQREVEYFQYEEHKNEKTKDKLGGGQETVITYDYPTEWTDKPINSDSFDGEEGKAHKNFILASFEDQEYYAEHVNFGAYHLANFQIKGFSGDEPALVNADDETLKVLNENINKTAPQTTETSATTVASANTQYVHVSDNVVYIGKNPSSPQVGDVRITFTKITPKKISLIAKVTNDTFSEEKIECGAYPWSKSYKTFSALRMGEVAVDEIFQQEHDNNTMLTWILRLVGVLCVIGGLKGIFGILETLAKVVPFIANIVGFGVSIICTIVGLVWSLINIALAWVFYRPLLGIAILVIAGGIIWYFSTKGKKKNAEAAAATAAPATAQPTETPSV